MKRKYFENQSILIDIKFLQIFADFRSLAVIYKIIIKEKK